VRNAGQPDVRLRVKKKGQSTMHENERKKQKQNITKQKKNNQNNTKKKSFGLHLLESRHRRLAPKSFVSRSAVRWNSATADHPPWTWYAWSSRTPDSVEPSSRVVESTGQGLPGGADFALRSPSAWREARTASSVSSCLLEGLEGEGNEPACKNTKRVGTR
jgi:hypothetical protein